MAKVYILTASFPFNSHASQKSRPTPLTGGKIGDVREILTFSITNRALEANHPRHSYGVGSKENHKNIKKGNLEYFKVPLAS